MRIIFTSSGQGSPARPCELSSVEAKVSGVHIHHCNGSLEAQGSQVLRAGLPGAGLEASQLRALGCDEPPTEGCESVTVTTIPVQVVSESAIAGRWTQYHSLSFSPATGSESSQDRMRNQSHIG